jgi:hypothetical protein
MITDLKTALTSLLEELTPWQNSDQRVSKRGSKGKMSVMLLCLAVLQCLLRGWTHQLDIWRIVSQFGVGHWAPAAVTDQAVYNRLDRQGSALMQQGCAKISQWLFERSAPWEDRTLAPFARRVLALDESVLESRKRWIADLRGVPAGDSLLLAGRLCCLFDIRRQQWCHLTFLPNATAHCQAYVRTLLKEIQEGTLLLFDLGYYNFEWFDTLTTRGIWWISRIRHRGSYQIEHILVHRDGYFEALVFLGAYRADRTAYLTRMVRVRYQGLWYTYVTNVTDPLQLPGSHIVRLYARRWDIELGFRLLKEYLGMSWLFSAKLGVIEAQVWATVLLAQLLHTLQVQTAVEMGVETFDVSLELLLRYLPDLQQIAHRFEISLTEVIKKMGPGLGLIRPHTRRKMQIPEIGWWEILTPPPDLQWIRTPRYPHKKAGNANRKPSS